MVDVAPPGEDGTALMRALGQSVLAAAAMEAFVYLDVVTRRSAQGVSGEELIALIDSLASATAGKRVQELANAGAPTDLIARLREAVSKRNHVMHHLLVDPATVVLVLSGNSGPLMDLLEELSVVCGELVEELAPAAMTSAATTFGITDPATFARAAHSAFLTPDLSDRERHFLEEIQRAPLGEVEQMMHEALGTSDIPDARVDEPNTGSRLDSAPEAPRAP